MKLSKEERRALERDVADLSAFMAAQKALQIIDAQHAALRNIRRMADAFEVDEDDDSDDTDCVVDCDLIAADLYTALNGLGCDDE